MSRKEKLERIRQTMMGAQHARKWYVKKSEKSAYGRYVAMQTLFEAEQPLTENQVAFKMGRSWESVRRYLMILKDNDIICDKLDCLDDKHYYTVCPVCPIKDNCEFKLKFWVDSGLMEPEPLPSKQFLEKEAQS